jgi:hypothetical protein
MTPGNWKINIVSEPDYEHLVAEVLVDGQLVMLLDREKGRDAVCVSLAQGAGGLGPRLSFEDFFKNLRLAFEELNR